MVMSTSTSASRSFLKEYLEAQGKSFDVMSIDERRSLYRKMGYEIVHEISNASIVTPYALISSGLLSHDRRGIAYDDLMAILTAFYDYLLQRKVNIATTLLANKERQYGTLLLLLGESNIISRMVQRRTRRKMTSTKLFIHLKTTRD